MAMGLLGGVGEFPMVETDEGIGHLPDVWVKSFAAENGEGEVLAKFHPH